VVAGNHSVAMCCGVLWGTGGTNSQGGVDTVEEREEHGGTFRDRQEEILGECVVIKFCHISFLHHTGGVLHL